LKTFGIFLRYVGSFGLPSSLELDTWLGPSIPLLLNSRDEISSALSSGLRNCVCLKRLPKIDGEKQA